MESYNRGLKNRFVPIKIPFSSHIKIDHFQKQPIFGQTTKHTLTFKDFAERKHSHVKTQHFHAETSYIEQPYCRLAYSNIHVTMNLSKKTSNAPVEKENDLTKFTSLASDDSASTEIIESINHCYASPKPTKVQVPVVLGEYTIGLCLEETTLIEKGIVNIQEVSKQVILTKCTFLPTQFTSSQDQMKQHASKGILFVEGYVQEGIEYVPAINREMKRPREWIKEIFYQIDQKLVIDLDIQLLQIQEMNVISE